MKVNSLSALKVAAFAATLFLSLPQVLQANVSVEQRLQYLEQQVETRGKLQADMNMQLVALQREVKELRGLVEEHQFKLQQIQERQRDLYRDIENRLSSISTAPQSVQSRPTSQNSSQNNSTSRPVTNTQPTQQQVVSGDERAEFEAAFTMVRNRQYSDAIKGFESFLAKHPQGSYSDNARFWIGQVYFAQSNLEQAEKQFSLLKTEYPNSSKLPNAMLKLAEIKVKQQKWEEAKAIYNDIVANYSGAQQQLARKGLQDLKQAGH